MKSITKSQLLAELAPFSDDAEVKISVGAAQYPVQTVISGNNAIWLEAEIETPATMGARGGRKITNESPKAIRQREYTRRWRQRKEEKRKADSTNE